MKERISLDDDALKAVNGGLIDLNANTGICTFINPDDTTDIRKYTIINHQDAYYISNLRHNEGAKEEDIVSELLKAGFIK